MSKVIFFCEGNDNLSNDSQIFKKLLSFPPKNFPVNSVDDVIGVGSKSYFTRYLEGYRGNNRLNNIDDTFYIGFRDRDFDISVPVSCELITFAGKETNKLIIFAGYRTTIENYLLSPSLFWQFINSSSYQGGMGAFANEQDCIASFNKAAETIRYHQAARHALGQITREGIPQMPSNFIKNETPNITFFDSGSLPDDLTQKFCLDKGKRNLQRYQNKAVTLTETKFETYFNNYVDLFDNAFVADFNQYIIWFNAKDLLSAIKKIFKQNLKFEDYYRFVMGEIDNNANYFDQFPDLIVLKNKIDGFRSQ